ncbi:MAG: hypothetical protein IPK59_04070 [Rhodospirillaceae bacterium]|nr:hypothetical protein [Rhodospirillaceae bacterium]
MTIEVIDATMARVKSQVAALQGRVEDVADLALMVEKGVVPTQTPTAWVVPIAEDFEPAADMIGETRQRGTETVGIVLVHGVKGDGKGAKARGILDALGNDVKVALLGWVPFSGCDPMELRRVRLVGIQAGCVFLQIDVLTRWYLRA